MGKGCSLFGTKATSAQFVLEQFLKYFSLLGWYCISHGLVPAAVMVAPLPPILPQKRHTQKETKKGLSATLFSCSMAKPLSMTQEKAPQKSLSTVYTGTQFQDSGSLQADLINSPCWMRNACAMLFTNDHPILVSKSPAHACFLLQIHSRCYKIDHPYHFSSPSNCSSTKLTGAATKSITHTIFLLLLVAVQS